MNTNAHVPGEGPNQRGESGEGVDDPTACRTAGSGEPSPSQGPAALHLKILVDCSRSMQGDGIEAAKRVLQALLPRLGPEDRFSLSRFGSRVEHRSGCPWPATLTARRATQRWIAGLRADLGGSGLAAALETGFALAQTGTADLLVITDGEAAVSDDIIRSARATGHRLFLIGVGNNPAEPLLRCIAEATGGTCEFIAPGAAVEPTVGRVFTGLRPPRPAHPGPCRTEDRSPERMSPLELTDWLQRPPLADWPRRHDDLRRIGLDALADRLGRALGATTEETAAIDACLFLMSQPEIREAFRETRDLRQGFDDIEQRLVESVDEIPLGVEKRLVAIELMTLLEGMTAHAWPED